MKKGKFIPAAVGGLVLAAALFVGGLSAPAAHADLGWCDECDVVVSQPFHPVASPAASPVAVHRPTR